MRNQQPYRKSRFDKTSVNQHPGKAAQNHRADAGNDLDRQRKAELVRDTVLVMAGLEQPGFISSWGFIECCPACGELTVAPYVIELYGIEPQSFTECGRCETQIVCEMRSGEMSVLAAEVFP